MKTLVIGAGISGLIAAYTRHQQGDDVTLWEASAHIGGAIRSVRVDGCLFELGPNTLVYDAFWQKLLQDLGLEDQVLFANPSASKRYILKNGQPLALPMRPSQAIRTPLISPLAKLRLLTEPFRSRGQKKNESLATFVLRRLGPQMLDYAVNPFVAGVYAGDPEQLCTRFAFPKLWQMEFDHGSLLQAAWAQRHQKRTPHRIASLQGGLSALPQRLAEILGPILQRNTPLTQLQQQPDQRWLAQHPQGQDSFDQVLLTLPAHKLPALLEKLGSPTLQHLPPHPPVTVVCHAYPRCAVDHPLDGFGMLIPQREQRRILGTLFSSSLFPQRAPDDWVTLTSFVGGSRQPQETQHSPDDIHQSVHQELSNILGIHQPPLHQSQQAWPQAIPQYTHTHGQFLQELETLEQQYPGLTFLGNYRHGISLGQTAQAAQAQALSQP